MKREKVLIVLIIGLYVVLIGSVLFINNPDFLKKDNTIEIEEVEEGIFTCETMRVTCEKVISVGGKVIENGTATQTLILPEDADVCVSVGDSFSEGDLIARSDDEEIKAPYSGRVLSFEQNPKRIRTLNYSALYVSTYVNIDSLEGLLNAESIRIHLEQEEFDSEITEVGYQVTNDTVEIKLRLCSNALVGESVNIEFVKDVREEVLSVLDEFVYTTGNKHYVYKYDGEKSEKVFVNIGERFKNNNNDFVEITSGLAEGDMLVLRNSQEFGERLNGVINNE